MRLFDPIGASLAATLCALCLAAGAHAEAADEEPARGIDVSHYQGRIRWDLMPAGSLHFAFIKATGGTHRVDPEFDNNWHGAREVGITRGAYHFFYAGDDPIAQAEHFARTVISLRPDDLPPVIDVEITDGATPEALVDGVLAWLRTVENRLGRRPIVYTYHAFANQYLVDPRLSGYPLWIAAYDVRQPVLPAAWDDRGWHFWQHTHNGSFSGVNTPVDLNVFNGSLGQLQQFIRDYAGGACPPESPSCPP
ncbi:glycoside hydrolase family 25 protein [Caldimonas sp. KR1-144]|uniref:glycoside hydrolase family 25 protein n=1 Tax=Caldimonas sp. KR1-144 TaxID=3400911 RepID=UPI003C0CB3C2